jgi:hypothetical protein
MCLFSKGYSKFFLQCPKIQCLLIVNENFSYERNKVNDTL